MLRFNLGFAHSHFNAACPTRVCDCLRTDAGATVNQDVLAVLIVKR